MSPVSLPKAEVLNDSMHEVQKCKHIAVHVVTCGVFSVEHVEPNNCIAGVGGDISLRRSSSFPVVPRRSSSFTFTEVWSYVHYTLRIGMCSSQSDGHDTVMT